MSAPTQRQLKFISDLIGKVAQHEGVSAHDVRDSLGLVEHSPWGVRARRVESKAQASAIIDTLRARLPKPVRTETLVAIAWDERAKPISDLLAALGDAVVTVTETVTKHHSLPRELPTWRIGFDSERLRNTYAHGRAVDLGYVAHVE